MKNQQGEFIKENADRNASGMNQNGYASSPLWAQIIIDFEALSMVVGTPVEAILNFIRQKSQASPSDFFAATRQYPGLAHYCQNAQLQTFWQNFPAQQSVSDSEKSFEVVRAQY